MLYSEFMKENEKFEDSDNENRRLFVEIINELEKLVCDCGDDFDKMLLDLENGFEICEVNNIRICDLNFE